MKSLNKNIIVLRAVAILLVMLGHSIILYEPGWGIYTTEVKAPYFVGLKDVINSVQMPLFFSISGYLFYYSIHKTQGFASFMKNKAWRLLIPYVCVALFYMDPIKLALDVPGYSMEHLPQLMMEQVTFRNNGHLWFLPCLFFIFVLMFFALRKVHSKRGLLCFLVLLGGVSIASGKLAVLYTVPVVQTVFQNAVYFYIGFIGNRFKLPANNKLYLLLAMLVFVITIAQPFHGLRPIGILCCLYLLYQLIINAQIPVWVDNISKNSYGLYLFHSPLIYITYTYLRNTPPYLVLFINFVVMVAVAYLLTIFVKSTKLRFIIGERSKKQ